MVRRSYDGTFHHISEEHLHRCINEFAGRYNVRGLDTLDMVETVAESMSGQRLKYFDLFNVRCVLETYTLIL